MGKELPIDIMSEEEFDRIRKGRLNDNYLDELTLKLIKEMFDLNLGKSETVRVDCDEAHAHDYRCLQVYNRGSAVVLRLVEEIERYKRKLDEIREKAEYITRI